ARSRKPGSDPAGHARPHPSDPPMSSDARVTCPACRAETAADNRFCGKCGTPLLTPASAPSTYTPKHLAEKILTSKSAVEGERKGVTVMFADVSGCAAM